MSLHNAYSVLYIGALSVLVVLTILCFIRAIKGPSIADRIVSINMIGTQILIMIGLVALLIGEGYLTDVALIYALISFLAVVVLCKVYMGVFLERRAQEQEEQHNA
ncbi:MAG: sodium:proton antiporter [Clostridiales bacterium]|nr:sodium:proton antiporter [Clostridiales bacterium]